MFLKTRLFFINIENIFISQIQEESYHSFHLLFMKETPKRHTRKVQNNQIQTGNRSKSRQSPNKTNQRKNSSKATSENILNQTKRAPKKKIAPQASNSQKKEDVNQNSQQKQVGNADKFPQKMKKIRKVGRQQKNVKNEKKDKKQVMKIEKMHENQKIQEGKAEECPPNDNSIGQKGEVNIKILGQQKFNQNSDQFNYNQKLNTKKQDNKNNINQKTPSKSVQLTEPVYFERMDEDIFDVLGPLENSYENMIIDKNQLEYDKMTCKSLAKQSACK